MTLLHTAPGQGQPLALASWLTTVAGDHTEHAIFLGAKEQGAWRLVASRQKESQEKRLYSISSASRPVSLEPLYHPCATHDMADSNHTEGVSYALARRPYL